MKIESLRVENSIQPSHKKISENIKKLPDMPAVMAVLQANLFLAVEIFFYSFFGFFKFACCSAKFFRNANIVGSTHG